MSRRYAAVLLVTLALAGCNATSPTEPPAAVITPACANPATLINAGNRAHPERVVDEYVVLLHSEFDVTGESARLASKHGFRVRETFTFIPAFVADLDPHVVAKLRCEASVHKIEFSLTNIPPP